MLQSPSSSYILSVTNLTIGYAAKPQGVIVASDINFNLQEGKLIGLVGANGIGKSTLLKTLIKLQPALGGDVLLNNIPLDAYNNLSLAKQLSVVLTQNSYSKNLRVFELVALGRQPYTNWLGHLSETDIAETNNALHLVGITHLKNKWCYELSDGQLQTVMIARALAQQTPLIVLDEPTTHLDMYHKAHLLTLLKQLTKTTGKTILFSSHEIDLAIQLCDSMLVMTKDTVFNDSPCELIEKGVFERLFPNNLIQFNPKNGSFKVVT